MKAAIIIPVYNMRDTVAATIKSAAAQTYPDFEVVVVDDGSTDNSYEIAMAECCRPSLHALHLFRLKMNVGIQRATNLGVRLYGDDTSAIVILGADDTLHPDFLTRTMSVLEDPRIAVVSTDMQYFGADNRICPTRHVSPTENNIPATSLIRKSVWDKMGGYDPSMMYEDWDLWLRIAADNWKFAIVKEPLFNYRTGVNPRSTMQNENKLLHEKQILDRHGVKHHD